ncbi:hypothetical protein BV372_15025 [Nostoc sp. T09]|uniref:SDR family NAD(P)-dependent oxidoreductase n=1 Tax=Nostoc sp. T09 TaxID=1932621 RepID=UPI000A373003|nr:SDR family NAD(P)-dependent oxidoreductase [Nostoc sp. T09]OUL34057.1 hypothetical protein BV372_15025 [Nostoc sp. T09]
MTQTTFSLENKIALVTGGNRGLGLEIVKALANAGAFVLVNARSLKTLESVVVAVTSLGGKAAPLQLDITDEAAVEKAFIEIKDKYGRLDILVNNPLLSLSGISK